jgi:AraC family transcriptional regulator
MDLTKGIQRAIQYIESNILDELDVAEIAKRAYVSPFHFQRLFHLLSGMTLGEYIRSRRLSLAAAEMQSGDCKIIDLSMKYGYDTPESFSRAYARFHGILPSAAKIRGAKIKSLSPLSIKVSLQGGSVLTYSVEEMKGFRMLGKGIRHGEGYEAQIQFWQRCFMDGTSTELAAYSTSPGKELFGVVDGASYDGKTQMYYVAVICDTEIAPAGYQVIEIPARTWIKFNCRDMVERDEEAEIWQRIYAEYFPASDYMPNEYQMMVYPAGDGSYPEMLGEIWVDVKK